MRGDHQLRLNDWFCGAGGATQGAHAIPGIEPVLAANHDKLAIETHSTNFPDVEHFRGDIRDLDVAGHPYAEIFWASPECFAAGTLILCERGLVPIEDVRIGDMVLTHQGRYRPVTATMSRDAETVRVSGQGLTSGIETTADHPFYSTGSVWTRVADMTPGETRWATPITFPAASIPPAGGRTVHVGDPRFAWLVGRWLGDGSLRVRDKGSSEWFITCGFHEADDLSSRITYKHHDCDECSPEFTPSRRDLPTAVIFGMAHSGVARWLAEHFGLHAHDKSIPAWVLGADEAWRRALLDGYLSADGHDNGTVWTATTVSRALGLGIRLLAESLGHRASLMTYHRGTWSIQGRSGKARRQWVVAWRHELKRQTSQTAFVAGNHSWGTVKKIEPTGRASRVYDLTIDEDHSFVADGIVVHNCTNWSVAKGRRADYADHPGLFGDEEQPENVQRSRALMEDVVRYLRGMHLRQQPVLAGVVENVIDIRKWIHWDRWLGEIQALGYTTRVIALNSAYAASTVTPRAPQSRDRLYVAYWHRSLGRDPDWDRWLRPQCWCDSCGEIVDGIQHWKRPGADMGRYGAQYFFRCPKVSCRGARVEPFYLPAAAAVDWGIEGQRIGDRARPLSPKTMARIEAALVKWGPAIVEAAGHTFERRPGVRSWPVTEPLRTLHATQSKALLVPTEGRDGKQARPDGWPLRTQTARNELGLLTMLRGQNAAKTTDDPLDTVAASGNHHGLLVPYYSSSQSGTPTDRVMGALTTRDRYALIMRNNTGGSWLTTPASEPLRTLTTAGHQSVLEPATVDVMDCPFRMLEPHEIGAGMAFLPDYVVLGTKRDKVRQYGNAVTPPAAEVLVSALVECIQGHSIEWEAAA